MARTDRAAAPQRILWLSWKDRTHPGAGGAEVVMHELIRRLTNDGHQVTLLTAAYKDSKKRTILDGATVVRVGRNRYFHSFRALLYYVQHFKGKFDLVVEVVNTAPYFAVLMPGGAKPVLLYHQLAREIWFHETRWPLSWLGYHVLESAATRHLAQYNPLTLSVSPSTSRDLVRHGVNPDRIRHLTEGIQLKPLASAALARKYRQPTLLSFGALRAMKQTLEQIRAFELAKERIPELRLKVAGGGKGAYAQNVLDAIANSPYARDIDYLGPVSDARKKLLMQRCHLVLVTSLKEGWCLVVSEANSQGTPAIVYDADGLRDSVIHEKTGLICAPNPDALADGAALVLSDKRRYASYQRAALAFSKRLTFDNAYRDFCNAVFDGDSSN